MNKTYFNRVVVGLLFLAGCREVSVIGEDFIESTEYELLLNSTIPLSFSTVRFDSLITSGQGQLLIGGQNGMDFGDLETESYFLIDLLGVQNELDDDQNELDDNLQYDSITLTIPLDGYTLYLDDETIRESIVVEQLADELGYPDDDNALYNYSEIEGVTDVPGKIVGEKEFFWAADRIRDLQIRLSDELGEDLFRRLENNDEIFSDVEEADEYLKGFRIYLKNSLFLVGIDQGSLRLTLHATDVGAPTSSTTEIDFFIGLAPHYVKFNHSAVPANFDVEELDDEIASDSLENQSFIVGGLGYATKIGLTDVRELLLDGEDFILAGAELNIRWLEQAHEKYPEQLGAQLIDEDFISLAGDQVFQLDRIFDDEYGRDNFYTMDVTDIVNFIMDQPFGEQYYLLITTDDFNTSPTSVILGDRSLRSEISIYTIKNE